MEKYFVVSKIQSAEDGSPYVYITLDTSDTSTNKGKQQTRTQNPFGNAFNIENMMKSLPKEFSNLFGGGEAGTMNPNVFGADTNSTTFKLSMREYQESDIRIGNRIKVGITKNENSGI